MALSIRQKLALLAGVPVVGSALLAAQVVTAARAQAKLAAALGSVESLVEASSRTTTLIRQLEQERTTALLTTGYRRHAAEAGTPQGHSSAFSQETTATTDAALKSLNEFLSTRNESALPKKFRTALGSARTKLAEIDAVRRSVIESKPDWQELSTYYESAIGHLTEVIAALTELSNDGELLRLLNPLVAMLELEARVSAEQALIAHSLAAGEFPPGAYRKLVATLSEEDIYENVAKSASGFDVQQLISAAFTPLVVGPQLALRRQIMNVAEGDELNVSPDAWLAAMRPHLDAFATVELKLHEFSRDLALRKISDTERGVMLSTTSAATIMLFSLIFAGALARGITRRLDNMRSAVAKVGEGDLKATVDASHSDELGRLAAAFNDMIREISHSRIKLGEQARMARDLEIATDIQRAMVPRAPRHPDFEFAGNMIAADEVGGDFYDVLSDGKELWITIGDVCGHGIGSGLVMLMTQVAFASNFLQNPLAEPAEAWKRVNQLLCENISGRLNDNRYVTAQLLAHRGQGRFQCVGAHQPPIIYRHKTQKCDIVDSTGPWLGLDPMQEYVPTSELRLEPGDVLCLYSDGLPESRDDAGDLFDLERLASTLESALQKHSSIRDASTEVYSVVEEYSQRRDDDWTLLLVRYRGA